MKHSKVPQKICFDASSFKVKQAKEARTISQLKFTITKRGNSFEVFQLIPLKIIF